MSTKWKELFCRESSVKSNMAPVGNSIDISLLLSSKKAYTVTSTSEVLVLVYTVTAYAVNSLDTGKKGASIFSLFNILLES